MVDVVVPPRRIAPEHRHGGRSAGVERRRTSPLTASCAALPAHGLALNAPAIRLPHAACRLPVLAVQTSARLAGGQTASSSLRISRRDCGFPASPEPVAPDGGRAACAPVVTARRGEPAAEWWNEAEH